MARKPRLSADSRWKLYRSLARWPTLSAALRARHYDKRELVREWLSLRNEREMLRQVRADRDVCWLEADDETNPLVTIAIPTFRRPEEVGRAVTSALNQTYENVEVLVVGDHTDDETEAVLRTLSDSRIRFVDLPRQGRYPHDPKMRKLVAGTHPMNTAIDMAGGSWIANCDDDDELLPNHVESLLTHARKNRLELAYSQSESVLLEGGATPGRRWITGSEPMRFASITRGSAFYSLGLDFMRYNAECWRIRDPQDWNLWKRMQLIGVRIGFLGEVTYRYNQTSIDANQ